MKLIQQFYPKILINTCNGLTITPTLDKKLDVLDYNVTYNCNSYSFNFSIKPHVDKFFIGIETTGATPTPPQPPTPPAGMIFWVMGDAGITKDGSDLVSVWEDQSPTGNDTGNGDPSTQPTWVDSVINGLPIVRFSPNDYLNHGILISVADFSIFIVQQPTGDNITLYGWGANTQIRVSYGGDYLFIYASGGVTSSLLGVSPTSTFTLTEYLRGAGNVEFYQNGNAYGTGINATNMDIDRIYGSGNSVDVAEILIYNTILSTSDRQAVEDYLNYKYDLW